jgi:thiamine-phosphate pyrophosphorylase
MKLIVVTSPTFFVEEDKIITALFEEGLDILHLRKPESPAIFSERLLTLIPEKYHRRIVTHDHFYLKEEFDLLGIHLNSRNPSEPHDYHGHVSRTCQNAEELELYKHTGNYLFLNNVFANTLGEEQQPTFTPEELRQMRKDKLIDNKVMAMGGITADNILSVKDFGFGGAVILDDLWNHFDICKDRDYLSVVEHFKHLKKLVD